MVLVPDTSQIVSQLYNVSLVITGPHLALKEVAELFAKLAIAGYDSSILGWYQKFKYLYWRPITALRQGDPTHKPDPTFATVLATPPHPEYPSLHSSNAGSWGIVLAKFLGISITEKIKPFIVNTEGYFLPPCTYNTINDVLVEIGISRVYGGIHFQKSVLDGTQLGDQGEYVLDRFEEAFGTI
ncbi:unnamed protein product [Sphagnum troendelagicum]|uniref:Phosphatidic acid phosphatase type 2/haloperoxidase domain-containing protein n=1 Tax=Sphagnum troendelagicum TaxID=128251 RepID=A0ABP0TTQ9_9BRYO